MAERKWGAITSGATFEALATTIVFFEDPSAALFGRRGKDGGQDARSGDGTRVYQAKHHESGSAAKAIADARKEAGKIAVYRQPNHERHEQWKGVTHWRLVSNAAFNPADRQTWDTEVVPLFTAQGLIADYWERATLDALLDKHPEIHRSFFEQENRAFLSIPEIRERLPDQEPFLQRAELGRFFGREIELRQIKAFLASENLFLLLHGQGGIGKTRLLVEAGGNIASEGEWQVLWANVASMAATGAWFEAVVPERPTLLLVDEPPDETLLRQLTEQFGGRAGRTTRWKVGVAVRSPKDPVLRFLLAPRIKPRIQELAIKPLAAAAAEEMCADLLKSGPLAEMPEDRRRVIARELGRRFDRHPVWLSLAIHLLEADGTLSKLPTTAKELAESYTEEVVGSQKEFPPQQALALLRWVALIGTVNREDDAAVKLIGEASGIGGSIEVRKRLRGLVERKALVQRGARERLVEIKPDVLRDHILLRWLSVNVGHGERPIVASEDAIALVAIVRNAVLAGNISALARTILVALARTELLLALSEEGVPLLDEFFQSVQQATKTMSVSHRLALAEVLETVASFRPSATTEVIQALRRSNAPEETIDGIFGPRILTHNDVVLALAWPLFKAAMGAQTPPEQEEILSELCRLAEDEGNLAPQLGRGLPNDGKRAESLIERILEGGPQFRADFDSTARILGERILADFARELPTPGNRAVLKALIQPAVALERSQTWIDDNTIHSNKYVIDPSHPAWPTRESLLTQLKAMLSADGTPIGSRIALWDVFTRSHQGLNRVRRQWETENQKFAGMLLDNLNWACGVLGRTGRTLEELTAARGLWEWHYRFDKDERLKEASGKLEALYVANDLASEFDPLFNHHDLEERGRREKAKGDQLAAADSTDEITGFIGRAGEFVGGKSVIHPLMGVAVALGEHAPERLVVRNFVTTSLSQTVSTAQSEFAIVVAAAWVVRVRKGDTPRLACGLVRDLLEGCGSNDQRVALLIRLYSGIWNSKVFGELSREEHELLREQKNLFLQHGNGPTFVGAIAASLHHDWATVRSLLEDVLRSVKPGEQLAALRALVDGVFRAVQEAAQAALPPSLGEWLLDQLLVIPDFDDLGWIVESHLEEILRRVGRVPLSWLPKALAVRRLLEAGQNRETGVRAVSLHGRLSKYVNRIGLGDIGNSNVTEAVGGLLEFIGDTGSIGYHLPEVIGDVDPEGLVFPAAVVNRLHGVSVDENLRRFARIGSSYAVGSPPWRKIAKAVVSALIGMSADVRWSICSGLAERGIRSWSVETGEVPAMFASAVQDARAALDSENDMDLRPFWEWRLKVAEAELRDQEEQAKEERGE